MIKFETECCSPIYITFRNGQQVSPSREAVMTDADLFQEFAKEALRQASKAKSESERLALNDLALTWVNAALASDRIFGSSFPAVH